MNDELQTETNVTENDSPRIYYGAETESIDSGKIPVWQQLTLLGILLFLLLGGVITPKIIAFFNADVNDVPASVPSFNVVPNEVKPANTVIEESAEDPFANIETQASAVYVWDVHNERALYKKNETEALPLASVTKLMTALVAHELIAEDNEVAIDAEAIQQYGNSGFSDGERFDRLSLSDIVLMSSSNDGAYALAASAGEALRPGDGPNAFVHAMNIRADEIGLHSTTFKNPTGLDISDAESGADGSAKDMAFLMEYIIENNPDILALTAEQETRVYSEEGIYHDAANTNAYVNKIPGLIGSKTGYTDLAGGNLVVAFNAGLNRPIVVSVLGSTRQARFSDVLALVAASQAYVSQN